MAERRYSDSEIKALLQERKPLPVDWRSRLGLRPKRGHQEAHLIVQGEGGNEFHLILRQSSINPFDFSVILAVRIPGSNRLFRLLRYNGRSHAHTNRIEQQKLDGFHIHKATERYQKCGWREDAYAEPTDRFSDIWSALDCLLEDASFVVPPGSQRRLFREV